MSTIAQYITQVLKPLFFLSRLTLNLISKDISWENLFLNEHRLIRAFHICIVLLMNIECLYILGRKIRHGLLDTFGVAALMNVPYLSLA